ncbi:MAG: hypothetical protein RL030_1357 [Pseudomonadota bacterium]
MPTRADIRIAYRLCHYCVETPTGVLLLRVGQASAGLDSLLHDDGARAAAVITASNPRSRRLPTQENARRHELLLARLPAGSRVLPTVAQDPHGKWPDEHGLLAWGLSRDEAIGIASAFDQHALLWCEAGEPVQLLWTGERP